MTTRPFLPTPSRAGSCCLGCFGTLLDSSVQTEHTVHDTDKIDFQHVVLIHEIRNARKIEHISHRISRIFLQITCEDL